MVEGSIPKDTWRHERLAYAGRVPVRVRGAVCCGDRIIPSGLHDGTGMRAAGSSGWQPAVGTVLSLGDEPECTGQPWVVEIAVTPPGLTVDDTRRPSQAGVHAAVGCDDYCWSAVRTYAHEQRWCQLNRYQRSHGTGRLHSGSLAYRASGVRTRASTFYSESDPYGEGYPEPAPNAEVELNDLKRSGADMVMDTSIWSV